MAALADPGFFVLTCLPADLRGHTIDRPPVEGILVYPTVDEELDRADQFDGRRVTVCTADLSKPWQSIRQRLFELAES